VQQASARSINIAASGRMRRASSIQGGPVKWISKIPPHLAHVATLPCEFCNSGIAPRIRDLGIAVPIVAADFTDVAACCVMPLK